MSELKSITIHATGDSNVGIPDIHLKITDAYNGRPTIGFHRADWEPDDIEKFRSDLKHAFEEFIGDYVTIGFDGWDPEPKEYIPEPESEESDNAK